MKFGKLACIAGLTLITGCTCLENNVNSAYERCKDMRVTENRKFIFSKYDVEDDGVADIRFYYEGKGLESESIGFELPF